MTGKHVIHELSIEDLIALAQGADEEVIMDKLSEAGKFIFEMKIKHGDVRIPAFVIYHTYKNWKGWDQKRQSKPFFFKDFKKYFEPLRTTDGMVYLLNPKPFDLSEDNYWLIRAEIRNEKTKKSKNSKR
jgi:hypothetical protein